MVQIKTLKLAHLVLNSHTLLVFKTCLFEFSFQSKSEQVYLSLMKSFKFHPSFIELFTQVQISLYLCLIVVLNNQYHVKVIAGILSQIATIEFVLSNAYSLLLIKRSISRSCQFLCPLFWMKVTPFPLSLIK